MPEKANVIFGWINRHPANYIVDFNIKFLKLLLKNNLKKQEKYIFS